MGVKTGEEMGEETGKEMGKETGEEMGETGVKRGKAGCDAPAAGRRELPAGICTLSPEIASFVIEASSAKAPTVMIGLSFLLSLPEIWHLCGIILILNVFII